MSLLCVSSYGFFSAGLRLRGRHALFPPRGEEKKAKIEQVRHVFHSFALDVALRPLHQRKKTLLVEYDQRGHAGGLLDRRFGENNPTMAPEERMLQRFTREMQRASKGVAFNLDNDNEELTHYGHSLSAMDDFDGVGLGSEDDDEGNGRLL